jgi:hypothetical protein
MYIWLINIAIFISVLKDSRLVWVVRGVEGPTGVGTFEIHGSPTRVGIVGDEYLDYRGG